MAADPGIPGQAPRVWACKDLASPRCSPRCSPEPASSIPHSLALASLARVGLGAACT